MLMYKMTRPKQGEPYSNKQSAICMRKKRAEMVKQDPLALRSTVWVINTANGKQFVFKDRKDIKIQRLNKQQINADCIKAF